MSFRAKYPGVCAICDDQLVEYNDDEELSHVLCPEDMSSLTGKPRPVCPSCFVQLPLTGKCDECFPDD